jgi:glucose-6-phosphate 1-dehydrogenase
MKPTIIVLVGITGDLAKRKLLPAINGLKEKGMLPEQFKLVGVTRRDDPELFKMDLDNIEDYQRLKEHLESIEKEWGIHSTDSTGSPQASSGQAAQRLFYLSVAPTVSLRIIRLLGESGLAAVSDTKLLLEKPFGLDLASAKEFIKTIDEHFSEEQVYRIDHYLAKDSVRALATRNLITEENSLEKIEIAASEKIGIEGRGDFYEQTGALRDFIQSHLLEVAAMAVCPTNRLEALQGFYIPSDGDIREYVQRGQYEGYREAVEKPESVVETMVSVELHSHEAELSGTAIVVKTGKAMDEKATDISLFHKDGAFEIISLDDTHNAYENVFADAINDKKDFFVSKDEVLATWTILKPIQEAWKGSSDDLTFYEPGAKL